MPAATSWPATGTSRAASIAVSRTPATRTMRATSAGVVNRAARVPPTPASRR
ncbi:MAG: hypothetical protein HZT41_02455 [Dechloromonas sp.]|nr:MAG: hypothetical protein HZT41_02455 [Dechloromonas sp.]